MTSEVKNFIGYLTEEIQNLEDVINYTKEVFYEEDMEFYGRHIRELQARLDDMIEEHRIAVEYELSLEKY